MTLTELKYIVAVARERHFGRAAESCFVSQPTLSVAIKKLEDELQVQVFERGGGEIGITPIGRSIVEQAQRVLEQAHAVKEVAQQGKDPLSGPLKVGIIYTIGPYLLPALIRAIIDSTPAMPLILHENFTVKLLELLRAGEIDVAILADPFTDSGLMTQSLYEEPFVVAVPNGHRWSERVSVASADLVDETMLLLGAGHCFRDHVLEMCPELARVSQSSAGIQKSFEGSSLETIRHMVASGIGVTVMPKLAEHSDPNRGAGLLRYLPFEQPVPSRRVMLAWRKSFPRLEAIRALRDSILGLSLPGVAMLPEQESVAH